MIGYLLNISLLAPDIIQLHLALPPYVYHKYCILKLLLMYFTILFDFNHFFPIVYYTKY